MQKQQGKRVTGRRNSGSGAAMMDTGSGSAQSRFIPGTTPAASKDEQQAINMFDSYKIERKKLNDQIKDLDAKAKRLVPHVTSYLGRVPQNTIPRPRGSINLETVETPVPIDREFLYHANVFYFMEKKVPRDRAMILAKEHMDFVFKHQKKKTVQRVSRTFVREAKKKPQKGIINMQQLNLSAYDFTGGGFSAPLFTASPSPTANNNNNNNNNTTDVRMQT